MHTVFNRAVTVILGSMLVAASGCSGGSGSDESVNDESNGVTNKGANDLGPRPGAAGAGAPAASQPIQFDSVDEQAKASAACFPGLSDAANLLCAQAVIRFQEQDSVSGTLEPGVGLGPTFNANGCAVCHSQPGVLGAGVAPSSPQYPGTKNPQVALATLHGATNKVPSFITESGPIREARFKSDGGVHGLFTIAGRSDAKGCQATQPDFETNVANDNVIFRIPIATFGDGLVELIPEMALEANVVASANSSLGIKGTLNRSGNDGTVTRFGWKAQNKSLTVFAAEAYNVEQGVTNDGFPNEREGGASNLTGCMSLNPVPEDQVNFNGNGAGTFSDLSADLLNFVVAMQLSAPPAGAIAPFTLTTPPGITQATVAVGEALFTQIGCAHCHTKEFTTAKSSFDDPQKPVMGGIRFRPFSDFAVHHMGTKLADGITQGAAGPDQFRSAPLWGVGQRLYFLHDGRTADLADAIAEHASSGSEANKVIASFNNLSKNNQQAILDFLRSL
jgi:CxxC motif-containing protein (DUF1111 family)